MRNTASFDNTCRFRGIFPSMNAPGLLPRIRIVLVACFVLLVTGCPLLDYVGDNGDTAEPPYDDPVAFIQLGDWADSKYEEAAIVREGGRIADF